MSWFGTPLRPQKKQIWREGSEQVAHLEDDSMSNSREVEMEDRDGKEATT